MSSVEGLRKGMLSPIFVDTKGGDIMSEKEIALQLTLAVVSSVVTTVSDAEDIGKTIGKLYNTILSEITVPAE